MNNSELILNDDGSVYHIGIRPEHCAPLIITVGDPDRVPIVSQFFDRIDFTNRKREICIHTGLLKMLTRQRVTKTSEVLMHSLSKN